MRRSRPEPVATLTQVTRPDTDVTSTRVGMASVLRVTPTVLALGRRSASAAVAPRTVSGSARAPTRTDAIDLCTR